MAYIRTCRCRIATCWLLAEPTFPIRDAKARCCSEVSGELRKSSSERSESSRRSSCTTAGVMCAREVISMPVISTPTCSLRL